MAFSECCQAWYESTCCQHFLKGLLFAGWLLFVVPLYYALFFLLMTMQALAGIFYGVAAAPCVYYEHNEIECWKIGLAIVFFPITLILWMGLGIKMLICDFNEDLDEMACVPCNLWRYMRDDDDD